MGWLRLTIAFLLAWSDGVQFRVKFVQKPLIGGPSFALLHRSVEVEDIETHLSLFSIDFIPKKPLEVGTIVRLLTLQTTEGDVRLKVMSTSQSENVELLDVAQRIQRDYNTSDFHLLFNNCNRFADVAMRRLEEAGARNDET